jgi:hypothetical protein
MADPCETCGGIGCVDCCETCGGRGCGDCFNEDDPRLEPWVGNRVFFNLSSGGGAEPSHGSSEPSDG